MNTRLTALVLSLAFVIAAACPSQPESRRGQKIELRDGKAVIVNEDGTTIPLPQQPPADTSIDGAPSNRIVDPTASVFEDQTRREYNVYVREQYKHALVVFDWQHTTSKIIFVTVIILVFSGLVLAALQFYWSYSHGTKTDTTLKVGLKGIEVASPVLGVVILVISLAFFYLYLVHIYPIHPLAHI